MGGLQVSGEARKRSGRGDGLVCRKGRNQARIESELDGWMDGWLEGA